MHGGMSVQGLILGTVYPALGTLRGEALDLASDALGLGSFLVTILICLLYMFLTDRSTLKIFASGTFGERIRSLLFGVFVGLALCGFVSMLAGLTGAVEYSFQNASPYLPALVPFVFIQCSCEEILLRGYVPANMEGRHHWSDIAFVSGTLFIFHHTGNLREFQFSPIFCLNVFLIGAVLYLFTLESGNFWIACGVHTAWNYTQQYLFGLPNSGKTSPLSLYVGKNPKAGFFYDPVYGNEGSLCTTAVFAVILVVLLIRRRKAEEGQGL